MAPATVTEDYYAVLGVMSTADAQAIKAAYRMLARVTHPDRNSNPNATEEFQLLQSAYETLNDPTTRQRYDNTRPRASTFSPPFATAASGTSSQGGFGQKRADDTTSEDANKTERVHTLERLQALYTKQYLDTFEVRRSVRKLEAELAKLREEDEAEAREAAARSNWWGSVSSFFFGTSSQEPVLKEESERRRLNRSAAIKIKTADLLRKNSELSTVETAIAITEGQIAHLKQQIAVDERRQQAEKRAQEQHDMYGRQRQEAERRAQAQCRWFEEVLRRKREAEMERERMEFKQREREQEEQKQREQEEKARKCRDQKENPAGRKGAKRQQTRASKPANGSQQACLHRGWWNRVPGRTTCSNCSQMLARFAFECPDCHIKACVSCRRTLKGTGGHQGGSDTTRWNHSSMDFDEYD
ncbi:hypothetical protein F5Y19DRAFT_489677 [Xylariaceae sp. FL1651]|nr:hypothetical protein F5Y19DRAFT_489677 [Xylariaceae sp. FL1651]